MRPHRSRSLIWAFVIFVVALGPRRADASFIVTNVNPPIGSLVQPFSTITVDFNQTVNPASLSDSDLTVNGVNASGFSVLTGTEVSFNVAAGAIPSGERVINTISVSGIQDSASETLTTFTETVVTDNVPPFVIANDGRVLRPAWGESPRQLRPREFQLGLYGNCTDDQLCKSTCRSIRPDALLQRFR